MAKRRSSRSLSISPSVLESLSAGSVPGTPPTLGDQMRRYLTAKFKGEDESDQASKKIGELREKCRNGNPFPLIAAQWPELVLTDAREIELFASPLDPERLHSLTPSICESIADPANPPLRIDAWQKIVVAAFFDPTIGEVAQKGATGCGKGCSVALGICLWYDAYEECRIALTSRDYSHAVTGIFGEVLKWFTRMSHPSSARVLGEEIVESKRHYIRVLNPDPTSQTAGEAFSGHHGPNTLNVFDEATSAPDSFFTNAEKNARKIIALANPRTMLGRFRNMFSPLEPMGAIDKIGVCYGTLGNRLCVTIGGADCANVRFGRLKQPVAPLGGIEITDLSGNARQFREGEPIPPDWHALVKPLIPEQIDLQQFRAICAKPDSREVAVFAHGKFPTEDPTTQIILSSWLARHEAAWLAQVPTAECFGFDVARSEDGDNSVLAAGGRGGVTRYHRWKVADVVAGAVEVIRVVKECYGIDLKLGMNPVCVDSDGLGAGACDALRALRVWVIEFHGNAVSAVDPRRYRNLRAEAYGTLGRRLNPVDRWKDEPWAIPTDDSLRRELVAPQKVHIGSDVLRWRVTSKDELKKLLGYSPDTGDATAYLFHAVREYASMNAYFAAAAAPLVVWPVPEPKESEKNGERVGASTPDNSTPAGQSAISAPARSPAEELLAYLSAEYGRPDVNKSDWRKFGGDD